MVELRRPDASLQQAWLAMAQEFGDGHIDGSGMMRLSATELSRPETFAAWVADLEAQERGIGVPAGLVSGTLRWIADGDQVVGTIHLRHTLNEFLLAKGGHIGYAVRPTARRRGVATEGLALMLQECKARGIDPVLVTCDVTNEASARTIEANGGVQEGVRNGKRRYWIDLPG